MDAQAAQVLIPIDFSEQSLIALDQSHNLAKFYNADLTLLHVIEEEGFLGKLLKRNPTEESHEAEIQKKLQELGDEKTKKFNIKTHVVIAHGRIADQILKTAEDISAKLILMGTMAASKDMKKKIIGSNALKVVRAASCPVITIKGKNVREGCRNIVMPIDLTKESREKVKNAIELGKLYGATIRVISMLYTLDKFAAMRLKKQVDQVEKFIKAAGVDCTTEITSMVKRNQSMAEAVISYANKIEADLILIMTQQEGEFKPLFIGSTAQDIINNSDVPVMSIVPSVKRAGSFSPY